MLILMILDTTSICCFCLCFSIRKEGGKKISKYMKMSKARGKGKRTG